MFRPFAMTALLALSFTTAQAGDFSTQVSFADLDLSRPTDAKVMFDRLDSAAKTVCAKANPNAIRPAALERCIDASLDMALAQIQDGLDQGIHDKMVKIGTVSKAL